MILAVHRYSGALARSLETLDIRLLQLKNYLNFEKDSKSYIVWTSQIDRLLWVRDEWLVSRDDTKEYL